MEHKSRYIATANADRAAPGASVAERRGHVDHLIGRLGGMDNLRLAVSSGGREVQPATVASYRERGVSPRHFQRIKDWAAQRGVVITDVELARCSTKAVVREAPKPPRRDTTAPGKGGVLAGYTAARPAAQPSVPPADRLRRFIRRLTGGLV